MIHTIGLCDRMPVNWFNEFRQACDLLSLPYRVISITCNDWMKQLANVDMLVWRSVMGDPSIMAESRTKIPLIEAMGIRCFPNRLMLWLYDDKIRETFFLRWHGYPTPTTFISFNEAESRAYAARARYPLVTKTHNGAGASGVMLIRSSAETQRLLDSIFRKETIIDKALIKYYYLRRLRHGSFLLERRFRARNSVPRYAYLQEFVESEFDWRITTMGPDLVSVFKRLNRPGDFRASGSGLWEKIDETVLPSEPCDLALTISNRHDFTCMTYDFMQGPNGWVIGEISYAFVLNTVYSDTLFRKSGGIYRRIEPIPIGVMHLQAALSDSETCRSC
jgi:glutathione synthase/RimK-type ligase-like ATP-grasp enzyme